MDFFFTFRAVTAAMGSSRARQQGCGYSLRVSEGRLHETKQVLGEAGGRYQKIYRKEADGQWQEVSP